MQEFGKVAVLMGGFSSEREVSLISGGAILEALKSKGIDAHAFDPKETPLHELKTQGFQTAFNILHGTYGEDGTVQGALELLGIPYTGSGIMASAVGMDKYRCKLIWQGLGLPVPEFAVLYEDSDFDAVEQKLGLPMFVKPAAEGSSVGVVKVKEAGRLKEVYQELKHFHGEIIAERFIGGGEYSCPVINGKGYPSILIVPATEFYDYEAKYNRDDTVYQCPSDLSPEDEALMRELAVKGAAAVGAQGVSRVDFLKDTDGKLYLLEINTLPGMTSHSLVPKSAAQTGLSFADLCVEILKTAHVG
ncbi:D-alanine--D-alanine ligase [Neisseria sp. Dent CA1/247]|uniref:D-alanine--D-alanine ligase n=1 Tax=Neisseria zoodegmatis TaxID=326523 RepID=A0A1X3CPY7_9NEIS|nr:MULTISPECIES: D-alanine--D-alanine ligase [Neisseria]OSI09628.1 D-alanine--D-alanine ligase [Neisseria zoodegmatis]UOO76910.1 D-alanine--D-alanine ligase [Neisseria sp. Dent CA1/247]SNU78899.1 D-alanine--D-alanine ligase [Neisseria zoodegmatis]SUA43992.1 D-alanine--D-alanine ligase [Neisseria zoodegmatis]